MFLRWVSDGAGQPLRTAPYYPMSGLGRVLKNTRVRLVGGIHLTGPM